MLIQSPWVNSTAHRARKAALGRVLPGAGALQLVLPRRAGGGGIAAGEGGRWRGGLGRARPVPAQNVLFFYPRLLEPCTR